MRSPNPCLLALYASVVIINSVTTGIIVMPVNTTADVYLVGYSSNLTSRTINCVSSGYVGWEGEWLRRTLNVTTYNDSQSSTLSIRGTGYRSFVETFFRNKVSKTREDGATLTGLPKTLELTVVLGLEQYGYGVVDTKLKKASCLHVKYTHAKPKYLIRYYDNNSLVLSDLIRNVSQLEPCSLWVTKQYIKNIPYMANETFQRLCDNPVYFEGAPGCPWFPEISTR
ncbi:uncharacterized protein LOC119454178 [Dermacentor silvarum]|uniref:uncharacterized protein LOC119454178 n=1 Tax=Dermacentor silvarum TaxID=543639 RepID=UPI002101A114|nr:uncharacterized protein LOC119454178 [Dermacentor silvarum]